MSEDVKYYHPLCIGLCINVIFFSMTYRQYCFTENNPDVSSREGFVTKLQAISDAWVFQLEKGENETPHYQGWLHLLRPRRLAFMKKNLSATAHFEPAKGTRAQNLLYCTKEPRLDGPWKEGDFTVSERQRTDLKVVIEAVREKRKLSDIVETFPETYIKFHHGIEKYRFIHDSTDKTWREVDVSVYWGDTGTGKTHTALTDNPDYFKLDKANNTWFDGYDGQSCLVIDDFYGWLPFGQLLNILDKYPLRLEIKGGFTWAKWTKVILTSNKEWPDWYSNISDLQKDALKRRIHHVLQFNK